MAWRRSGASCVRAGTLLVAVPLVWEYDRTILEHRYTGPELASLFAGWDDVTVVENGGRAVSWATLTGSLAGMIQWNLPDRRRLRLGVRPAFTGFYLLVNAAGVAARPGRAALRPELGDAPDEPPAHRATPCFVTSRPDVTVVIPTRNRWTLLASAALPAALGQEDVDVEVVVVDDGSSDETPERLAELTDPRLRVVRHARVARRGAGAKRRHRGRPRDMARVPRRRRPVVAAQAAPPARCRRGGRSLVRLRRGGRRRRRPLLALLACAHRPGRPGEDAPVSQRPLGRLLERRRAHGARAARPAASTRSCSSSRTGICGSASRRRRRRPRARTSSSAASSIRAACS